jgi:anti-sigma factor RsiW
MRCERIQWLLSAHADGELPSRTAAAVARHLAGCETCAAEARSFARLRDCMRDLPEEDPPAQLRAAIFQALDTAQPAFRDRLRSWASWLYPAPALTCGAAAAGLAVLVLSAPPLQHGQLAPRPIERMVYRMRLTPLVTERPAKVMPDAPKAVIAPSPPAAEIQPAPVLPAPELLADALPAPKRVSSVTSAKPAHIEARRAVVPSPDRRSARKPGTGHPAPSPAPTFDPLAPVFEPNRAPTDPAMPNVVMVDQTPVSPDGDSTMVATMPSSSDMTSSGSEADDLEALRQRLQKEQLEIPQLQFNSRPTKPKRPPILRSQF